MYFSAHELLSVQGDYPGSRPQANRSQTQLSAWYYASHPTEDPSWTGAPIQDGLIPQYSQEPAPVESLQPQILSAPQPRSVTPPSAPEPRSTQQPNVQVVQSAKRASLANAPSPPATTPTPIAKPIAPAPVPASPSPALSTAQPVKLAWAKADEPAPKTKQTLRDIQEAEARQAELQRKTSTTVAPKTLSRAASEDVSTITASWGLPTSQAGQAPRVAPKEPSPQATTGPSTAWSTAAKPVAVTKKSVKQIQEEEEQHKRLNAKDAELIAGAKRAYAQTANKVR